MKKKILSVLLFAAGAHLALAQTSLPRNLWINGNFEGPDLSCSVLNPVNDVAGWNSIFIWRVDTPFQTSVNEPDQEHTFHTPNTGHYLYCDPRPASGASYQIRQIIPVQPNRNYDYSIWVTSMRLTGGPLNPAAQIQLRINGVTVSSTLTLSGLTTDWQRLSITTPWNSGSNTSATVEIVALNPTVAGHDFAVDDIVFTQANLWTNGDFEGTGAFGNFNPVNTYSINAPFFGFTTFRYVGSGPPVQPQFLNEASFDHTYGTGQGHFLYCDPRAAIGNIYQIRMQITVQPNTDYDVSAWFTSMLLTSNGNDGGRIRIFINGVSVTPTLALEGTTTQWIELHNTAPWNSGANTTATVDIVDLNPSVWGHDYAIDDIFFGRSSAPIPPLTADAGPPYVFIPGSADCGQTYTLGGTPSASGGVVCNGYTYNWTPTTYFVFPSNANSANPQVLFPGIHNVTYTLTVTDANGNTATDQIQIQSDCPERRPTATPELLNSTGNINIYPNPVTGLLRVEHHMPGNISLQIADPLGRVVFTQTSVKGNESIDVSAFRAGIYYIRFNDNTTGTLIKTSKFLKK